MSGILETLFGKKEEGTVTQAVAGAEAEVLERAAGSNAKPIHVTDETFQELVLNSPLPTLVDFWAPWCAPCRMIAPIVEDLARDYEGRAQFAKVNTDDNVEMAGRLGIMGIPTLILFKDGREFDRVVGYVQRRTLEDKLKAALS